MARKTTKPITRKPKATPLRKQQKPIFRTGTWFTLLLLAALIGFTYYLNSKEPIAELEATPAREETFVFGEQDGNITSIEIKPTDANGETVKVARGSENVWALELPFATEADQGLVEAAASQVAVLRIVSEVDADASILGLDQPAYVITIEFADGTKRTLEVGDNTPTNSGYYVRLDRKKIMILTLSGIDSLTALTRFPPYLNTPTPSPLPPTTTPDPPTEAASTPEAAVTPTP
ncbi:MAG: DUF4340 domain-containing protein [Anaerolineales bacterium]|nr:DUF4340 domain-containing protein [Anaerolineales bacterium]MDP2777706.1 DUF4340 domain-containing protein [Anaerolineales bacterium]